MGYEVQIGEYTQDFGIDLIAKKTMKQQLSKLRSVCVGGTKV